MKETPIFYNCANEKEIMNGINISKMEIFSRQRYESSPRKLKDGLQSMKTSTEDRVHI